ncbi:hypothetical protein DAI22_06g190000 [Oryza sativa Japonica Group]|nr:hypothetical protein DAI22_06g190000 [Oryza sativa Japonica Group]
MTGKHTVMWSLMTFRGGCGSLHDRGQFYISEDKMEVEL